MSTNKHNKVIAQVSLVVFLLASLVGPITAYAKIDYYGFYFVENDANNVHYMSELKDSNNILEIIYDHLGPTANLQDLSNRISQNNYTAVKLGLGINEAIFMNTGGARDTYLSQAKTKMSVNSNLINKIKFIGVLEEEFTLLSQGFFDSWAVFQNISVNGCQSEFPNDPYADEIGGCKRARMRKGLEQYITAINTYFPGIPTQIVENYWGYAHIPPSNLDILGLDAYYIPTSDLCDATQRARFDDKVTGDLNLAKQYGKPIYMVAPVYSNQGSTMLSECQAQWYIDLAKNTPEVIGLDWFLYANIDNVHGIRSYSGPTGSGNYSGPLISPLEYIKSKGREILGNLPTGGNNQLPAGNFDGYVAGTGTIGGWAYDPDHKSDQVNIKVYVGGPVDSGTLIGTVSTDGLSPDVNVAMGLPNDSKHRFGMFVPNTYRDGIIHSAYAYAIDSDNGTVTALSNNPKTFRIKKGDVNKDDLINVADYTELLTDFKKTGARNADLNNDSLVDIFDYNILVENFGK